MGKTKVCLGCGDLAESGGIFCQRCRELTQGGLAKRVMIFTEDVEIVNSIKEEYTKRGCSVQWDRNLSMAEQMLKKDVPHLVILDTETAATIGLELTTEIKASQFGIKLIVIGASEKAKQLFMKAGADFFFMKPMDKIEFMTTVGKILTGQI